MFTARYGLSLYITQICFILKRLSHGMGSVGSRVFSDGLL